MRLLRKTAFLAFALFCLASCQDRKAEPETPVSIVIYKPQVSNAAGAQTLSVTAGGSWTLEVQYEGTQANWVTLEKYAGVGSESGITLSRKANPISDQRSCNIVLTCGSQSSSISLIQGTRIPGWMELPATNSEDLIFASHTMSFGGDPAFRNYSLYWDCSALVAHWVAYPLNKELLNGSAGRTEAWQYDTNTDVIPRSMQPCLFSGYADARTRQLDRGHQIPSADRQQADANAQTFFFTNMTPQNSGLNGGVWGELEGCVRNWAKQFDTLYVATGCVVKGSTSTVNDNLGKPVTIPVGYFKALLGYKISGTGSIGNTLSQKGYTSVAFYYANEPNSKSVTSGAMTVRELENKTGFDFFVNLPGAVGQEMADKIETTKDNWWYK